MKILKYRVGDIMLVKYRLDIIGWIIRRLIHSQWNHVAWVINRTQIVEARLTKITINPIQKYLGKFYYKVEFRRIKYIDNQDLKKAIKYAKSQIRKRSILTTWLTFLLIALNSDREITLTCSGLIATALDKKANWHFCKSKNPKRITPADISKCRKMEKIYE